MCGEAAIGYLRAADARMPGLILLDLNMPGLDGRKTLQIIKQSAPFKDIPVVILTTSNDERDVSACYALGANTINAEINGEHEFGDAGVYMDAGDTYTFNSDWYGSVNLG